MKILNNKLGNNLISSYTKEDKVFTVDRVGITKVTTSFYRNKNYRYQMHG